MIIQKKTLIPILCLLFELLPCYALNTQIPFFLKHHDIPEKENTLSLKTIYHHGSVNGPIPKLFRKLDLDPIQIHQANRVKYGLKSKLGVMDRPSTADRNDLLFQINNKSSDKLVRWSTIAEEKDEYRAMQLESTIGVIPDVTHRPSILSLAQMTYNAYLDIDLNNTEWYDLGASWKLVSIL